MVDILVVKWGKKVDALCKITVSLISEALRLLSLKSLFSVSRQNKSTVNVMHLFVKTYHLH